MSPSDRPSPLRRILAATLALALGMLGCPRSGQRLGPAPGMPQYQEPARVTVPGGFVNPMGGNLLLHRVDLEVDTRLGPIEAGAWYSSATGVWTWSFEITWDGTVFVDPTGSHHVASGVADGAAIPGTTWVRLDAATLRTKGGLVHEFAQGRLAAIRWADAAFPRLEVEQADVAGAPRTVAVRQCTAPGVCSPVFDLAYDAAGELAEVSDRAGRRATFVHQGGRLVEARDALDHARGWPGFRYGYDAAGRLASRVSSEGERVEVGYLDGRVDRVRAVGAGDPTMRFAYEARQDGLFATRVTDPLGNVTVYRYDARRRLHAVESKATGDVWRWTWSGMRPDTETAPDGATTRWTWADDDPATRQDPSGNTVRFTRAPDAVDREDPMRRPVAEIRDDLGLVERRAYDATGRLLEVRNGEDEVVLAQTWRADGTVATRTTPEGVVRYGAYGEHGHPLSVTVDGADIANRYDAVGNPISGWLDGPAPGGVVRRRWDEDRNLSGVLLVGADGPAWVTVEHRSDGQRLAVRRPHGGDHEMVYDALGRMMALRERAQGVWRATTFTWDAAGRLVAVQRPNGMRRETDHDALGRTVALRWLRHGVLESEARFTWQSGRLVEILDSSHGAPERLAYDGAGRLLLTAHPRGGFTWRRYDLRSRLVAETFERGDFQRVLERDWDLADREVALRLDGEDLVARSFQGGRLARVDTGNGLSRHFTWDPESGILQQTRTLDPQGAVVASSTLSRASGTIAVDTHTAVGVVARTHEEHFLAQRVVSSTGESGGARVMAWAGDTTLRSYQYDATGHRMDDPDATFTWDAERRRLLRAAGPESGGAPVDYVYDAAGFVVERGGVPLTWTASGRLASFGDEATFAWDALERPLETTVAGVTRQLLFGGRVEADAQGNPLALDLEEVRVDLIGGSRLYRHQDFRRNVKFTTDEAGRVVAHYAYHPYGVQQVHGATDDRVRFVGGTDLGELVMVGVRIFDPLASRFLSPDPVFQIVDDFSYALGNPVQFIDPEGELAVLVLELILSSASFAAATTALILSGSATTTVATISAIGFGVSSLAFALAAAKLSHAFTEEGIRGSGLGGGSGSSCSPTSLTATPRVPRLWVLAWLLGLAIVELERRRRARRARV